MLIHIQTQLPEGERDFDYLKRLLESLRTEYLSPAKPASPSIDSPAKALTLYTDSPPRRSVIFLDVDGVVFPYSDANDRPYQQRKEDPQYKKLEQDFGAMTANLFGLTVDSLNKVLDFDRGAISRLKALRAEFDARIVISSSWRRERSIFQLKNLFQLFGLGAWVVDKTSIKPVPRGEQIQTWLVKNHTKNDRFVVLDDNKSDFDLRFPNAFVQCPKEEGFIEACYLKAMEILQAPPYPDSTIAALWQQLEIGKPPERVELSYQDLVQVAIYQGIPEQNAFERFKTNVKNTNMRALKLQGFPDTFKIGKHAAHILADNPLLERLELPNNAIKSCKSIRGEIRTHQNLRVLDIQDNPLKQGEIAKMATFCERYKLQLFKEARKYCPAT